ncbi:MAG: glycosyltransferase family 39 protein [Candidatus Omnitrophica bacterium]|nr:glycosyltransferase family 39 protein [Candidatus Omnitrophota bacterium]
MNLKAIPQNKVLIIFAILIVGLLLRVYKLDSKSLWYDEACALSFTEYNLSDVPSHRYIAKPVYFLILKPWVSLFGSSESAGRSLSVIFGLVSIFLIYKLAKILFGRSVGAWSAFILAISPYHIYHSQQLRNYSLFVLLGILSMFLFVKSLEKTKNSLYLVFHTLINGLLIYTHPYGIFIIIAQSIVLFAQRKRVKFKRRWVISQIIVLLCFISLVSVIVTNPKTNEIDYIQKPDLALVLETFEAFSYGGPRQAHGGLGFWIDSQRLVVPRITVFIFLIFCLMGLIPKKKFRKDSDLSSDPLGGIILILLWLVVPIICAYSFSKIFFPIYITRYLVASAPAFYIIVARGISQMPRLTRQTVIPVVIIFLSVFSLNILYNPQVKGDWRDGAIFLKERIKKEDAIVFVPLQQIVPFWYYYKYGQKHALKNIDRFGRLVNGKQYREFYDKANFITGIELDARQEDIENNFNNLAKNDEDIWLIVSPGWMSQKSLEFTQKYLDEFYVLKSKSSYSYNGVEILQYSVKN